MGRPSLILAMWMGLGLAAPAQAGIVDVQPLLSPADEDGLTSEASAGLNVHTGNVDLVIANANLLLRYQHGRHRFISSSGGQIGFSGGEEFLNDVTTHLRHQGKLVDWLTWETYLQWGRNPHRRLVRGLAGTGPRFALIDAESAELAVAVSYLYENQRFTQGDYPDSGVVQHNHRISSYVTGNIALDPVVTLVHTSYFQPRLDAPWDYRLLSRSGLSVQLTEQLGLLVNFSVSYYTAPPHGVKPLDSTTSVGLTYKLGGSSDPED